jgi:hypothetical protein
LCKKRHKNNAKPPYENQSAIFNAQINTKPKKKTADVACDMKMHKMNQVKPNVCEIPTNDIYLNIKCNMQAANNTIQNSATIVDKTNANQSVDILYEKLNAKDLELKPNVYGQLNAISLGRTSGIEADDHQSYVEIADELHGQVGEAYVNISTSKQAVGGAVQNKVTT